MLAWEPPIPRPLFWPEPDALLRAEPCVRGREEEETADELPPPPPPRPPPPPEKVKEEEKQQHKRDWENAEQGVDLLARRRCAGGKGVEHTQCVPLSLSRMLESLESSLERLSSRQESSKTGQEREDLGGGGRCGVRAPASSRGAVRVGCPLFVCVCACLFFAARLCGSVQEGRLTRSLAVWRYS